MAGGIPVTNQAGPRQEPGLVQIALNMFKRKRKLTHQQDNENSQGDDLATVRDKPKILSLKPSEIPNALRKRQQFVVWKLELSHERWAKIPYSAVTGERAKVDDPGTWTDFQSAENAFKNGDYSGIGFVFSESDPYVGIDLDDCRNPRTGKLAPSAQSIIGKLGTYAEVSPSGTGIKLFAAGKLPIEGTGRRIKHKGGEVEIYQHGRFFTVTGHRVGRKNATVRRCNSKIQKLWNNLFGKADGAQSTNGFGSLILPHNVPSSVSDDEILCKAMAAANGQKFKGLWNGDSSSCGGDDSAADLALCSSLAFWTGPDINRIDRLFRQSKLMRPKWDKTHYADGRTYGQATIQKALTGKISFFNWQASNLISLSSLSSRDWPILGDEALYGLAGEIVNSIDPYTESDPVATLGNILAMFGNVVGSHPRYMVGHAKHATRINVVNVGLTSKGRKGTSLSTPLYLFGQVDKEWAKQHISRGLSTGEGLIYAIRDLGRKTSKKGVEDKRLLVIEEEFASPLIMMRREGNVLSAVMRQAWDAGDLATMTRNDPLQVDGAHISIIGHITAEELSRHLSDTNKANGFANRFLWLLVKRSKELPEGATPPAKEMARLSSELKKAVDFARKTGELHRDDKAHDLWHSVYSPLSAGREGLSGAVTSRAEAQVLRLSINYALLDRSKIVRVEHLVAALTAWKYADQSASYIFGGSTGSSLEDRISVLLTTGPLSTSEISRRFGGHITSNDLSMALGKLETAKRVEQKKKRTNGAPKTVWTLVAEKAK